MDVIIGLQPSSHEEEAGKHKVASKELEVCVDRGLIRVGWSVECRVQGVECGR